MLTFNEELHEYRLNGQVVPSVSEIIEPLNDFRFVSQEALERARVLGRAIHLTIQYWHEGTLDEANTPELLLKYLASWKMFCSDLHYRPTMLERRVCHQKLRYAGTLDNAGVMNDNDDWLLDVKSGQVYPGHALQTMGYKLAGIEEKLFTRDTKRACVYLDPEGYDFKPRTSWDHHDEPGFIGLLTVNRWRDVHDKRRAA